MDEIINESIEAEEHPDYHKVNGKRVPENGYKEDSLMHRFYGAVEIDGKTYRVKTTMKEHNTGDSDEYTYEVINAELLPSEEKSSSDGCPNVSNVFVDTANLLNGVEKSYDPGVKLLDVSENKPELQSDKLQNEESFSLKPEKYQHKFNEEESAGCELLKNLYLCSCNNNFELAHPYY